MVISCVGIWDGLRRVSISISMIVDICFHRRFSLHSLRHWDTVEPVDQWLQDYSCLLIY